MTTPDRIEAAARIAIEVGAREYWDSREAGIRDTAAVVDAIRAAAQGLIAAGEAAGREKAATAIEVAGTTYGCDFMHMDWAAEIYAGIARGGGA
jgi:hypothetical protein